MSKDTAAISTMRSALFSDPAATVEYSFRHCNMDSVWYKFLQGGWGTISNSKGRTLLVNSGVGKSFTDSDLNLKTLHSVLQENVRGVQSDSGLAQHA